MKKMILFAMVLVLGALMAACGSSNAEEDSNEEVTIGYFPNINHVAGMVAEEKTYIQNRCRTEQLSTINTSQMDQRL